MPVSHPVEADPPLRFTQHGMPLSWRGDQELRRQAHPGTVPGRAGPPFAGFRDQAEKRLQILRRARSLEDPRGLPSNRLEALAGDREEQFSIRINRQWLLSLA